MTKQELLREKTALGLSANYDTLVKQVSEEWAKTNPTIPFSVPTRSELTQINESEFPQGKVHTGVSTGLTRLTACKNPLAKSSHYPQIAVDFNGNVKFLLGANVPENTELHYETKPAMVKNPKTNEMEELFTQSGIQIFNLVQCAKDKFESAATVEAPKRKKKTA